MFPASIWLREDEDISCTVKIVRFSGAALRQAKYREKHPNPEYNTKHSPPIPRNFMAPTFDELPCPEFTAAVEAESRRIAWQLNQEVYGKRDNYKEFCVEDHRPYSLSKGHTASKAKFRPQKMDGIWLIVGPHSTLLVGEM